MNTHDNPQSDETDGQFEEREAYLERMANDIDLDNEFCQDCFLTLRNCDCMYKEDF